jgi:hypothetical protein
MKLQIITEAILKTKQTIGPVNSAARSRPVELN